MGDHPRSRGGNFVAAEHVVHVPRTIPARAGETSVETKTAKASRDHPRSRGGNYSGGMQSIPVGGPSPLARGKRNHNATHRRPSGTIPARAGETAGRQYPRRPCRDHPRSRGGNGPIWVRVSVSAGPSPLARGKHIGADGGVGEFGTIPARAGETPQTDSL